MPELPEVETVRRTLENFILNKKIREKINISDNCDSDWIVKEIPGDEEKNYHILSILEIKKMIPLKDGFYEKMDFERIEDDEYVDLLKKEY